MTLPVVIAEGSMGVVYKTRDRSGRAVALKVLRRELREDPSESFAAGFRDEARLVSALRHPGIVSIYEHGDDHIAMEYVEGRSLRDCFTQRVAFEPKQAVDIMAQLLDALDHAHGRGVCHCDVCPANILLTADGRVKLTDFGIARAGHSASHSAAEVLGTPGFIAPERYLGEAFDGRVDVFAAGAVLYQLLAEEPPFVGTAAQIMVAVCRDAPLPPSVVANRSRLRAFDAVVARALARDPEERFPSAREFRAALLRAYAS